MLSYLLWLAVACDEVPEKGTAEMCDYLTNLLDITCAFGSCRRTNPLDPSIDMADAYDGCGEAIELKER